MSIQNQLINYTNKKLITKRPSEDTRQYVYRLLSTLILNMILIPGQRMNEQELSAFLNVSRTPIHDSFPMLARNNLVDIIPMKGSFVSKVDKERIKDSIWLNEKMCISIIQGIFISDASKSELDILSEILSQLEYNRIHGDIFRTSRSLAQFYRHLFILGGNFEIMWESLYEFEADLFRLYSLAIRNLRFGVDICRSFHLLTNALLERDNDLACKIFHSHMQKVLSMVEPITADNPKLFNTKLI